ncbi:MAG: acyl--CoA ligase, partial [Proteobacteria bacterium]|nr:acyl--CoA ligase [Pseudomonadota bacterium]
SSQHIYGMLFSILWPLKYGHRIWQKNIPFEESLENVACQYDEIIMVSSPAFLKRLSLNNLTLKGKMLSFCSGGILTQEQHKNAEQQLNSKINQVYGSSETGGIAHRALQTSWQFFSSVKHKVEKNSLYINSPFCYHSGWLDTNDSVTVCADGFELLGRNDRIVKIEEKRISLIQLERAIECNKLVEEAHVIAITKQRQYIVTVIVLNLQGREKRQNIGEKRLKQEIKTSLKNKVEKLAIPKKIRFMTEIPVNSQGKTTRQQITAVFAI